MTFEAKLRREQLANASAYFNPNPLSLRLAACN
jgi:hypothetical protein